MSLRQLVLTPVAGLILCLGTANAGAEIASCGQIGVIIDNYFEAMGTGDVPGLLDLTAGKLGEQHRLQSENPSYPGYLVERYANVEHEIMACAPVSESIVEVNVLESLSWNERVQKQFQLEFFNEDSVMQITNISLSVLPP